MKYFVVLSFLVCEVYASSFLPGKFSVEIDQVYQRFGKGKEVRTPYTLEYSYPGKMKYLNQKSKSLFICNKDTSWYYVPSFLKSRPGTVKVNSGESFRLVSLFDSLKSGLTSNETYKVKEISDTEYQLIFTEKSQKDFNVKTANLYISNRSVEAMRNSRAQKMPMKKSEKEFTLKDLEKILIEYRDNKKLTLEFKSFESGVDFDSSHFTFSIPENTKVIK